MIEYFGVENIMYFVLAILVIMGLQIDRFSRHANKHIDRLQERIYDLEKRLGL